MMKIVKSESVCLACWNVLRITVLLYSEWFTLQDLSRYARPANASFCHRMIEYKGMFLLIASDHLCTCSEVYVEPEEIRVWSCELHCMQIDHMVQQHRRVCLLPQPKQRLTQKPISKPGRSTVLALLPQPQVRKLRDQWARQTVWIAVLPSHAHLLQRHHWRHGIWLVKVRLLYLLCYHLPAGSCLWILNKTV